jgi:hypothetical protein
MLRRSTAVSSGLVVAATVLLSATGLLAAPSPAAAECAGGASSVWPSFRLVVGTAPRVLIGEVIAGRDPDDAGRSSQFRLRVVEVLRGTASRELELGQPLIPELASCLDDLRVAVGEVLALALPPEDSAVPVNVLAVAFVGMDPARSAPPAGVESLSMDEVRSLAATPGLPMPLILVAAVLAILAAGRRWAAERAVEPTAERAARDLIG